MHSVSFVLQPDGSNSFHVDKWGPYKQILPVCLIVEISSLFCDLDATFSTRWNINQFNVHSKVNHLYWSMREDFRNPIAHTRLAKENGQQQQKQRAHVTDFRPIRSLWARVVSAHVHTRV